MNLLRFIRAAIFFARHQAWVDEPEWRLEDATALRDFFATDAGIKFRMTVQNLVLRQQAAACQKAAQMDKKPEHEAGFANGQAGLAAVIQALADTDPRHFTTQETDGADPAANT